MVQGYSKQYQSIFKEPAPLTTPTASMEGIFDNFLNLFKKKEELDAKQVSIYRKDLGKLKEFLARTLANPEWVKKNKVDVPEVTIGANMYLNLIYTGKQVDVLSAIDIAYGDFNNALKKNTPILTRFFSQHEKDLKYVENFYKPGKTTTEEMLAEMRKIIQRNPIPNLPDKGIYEKYKSHFSTKPWDKVKGKTFNITPLSEEQVIQLAKNVIDVANEIEKVFNGYGWLWSAGADWGVPAWDDETDTYDGEEIRTSDEFDYFYWQGVPDELSSTITDYLYRLSLTIQTAIYVASYSVRMKRTNFSTESIFSLGIGDEESLTPLLKDEDFVIEEDGVLKQGAAQITQDMETYLSLESLRDRIKNQNGVSVGIALECLRVDSALALPNYLDYSNKLSDKHMDVTLERLESSMESLKEKAIQTYQKILARLRQLGKWLWENFKKFGAYVKGLVGRNKALEKSLKEAPSDKKANTFSKELIDRISVSKDRETNFPISIQGIIKSHQFTTDFVEGVLELATKITTFITTRLENNKGKPLDHYYEEDASKILNLCNDLINSKSQVKTDLAKRGTVEVYGFMNRRCFAFSTSGTGVFSAFVPNTIAVYDKPPSVSFTAKDVLPLIDVVNKSASNWSRLEQGVQQTLSRLDKLLLDIDITGQKGRVAELSVELSNQNRFQWQMNMMMVVYSAINMVKEASKLLTQTNGHISYLINEVERQVNPGSKDSDT